MAKLRNIFKKHLIPNLESKCRLCLSDKAIVQCIFQPENSKEVTDTLVEKIFECTAIMLHKDYDFPSPICEDCAFRLDEFLLFRTKCLRSNEIYRFNRLHKQRFLFTRKPPVDDSSGGSGSSSDPQDLGDVAPSQESPEHGVRVAAALQHSVPLLTIAEVSGSSSSDSHTVINKELLSSEEPCEGEVVKKNAVIEQVQEEVEPLEASIVNGDGVSHSEHADEDDEEELIVGWKPPEPDDSEGTSRLHPAPVVLLMDETDTTVSEGEEVEEELVLPLSELMSETESNHWADLLAIFGDIPFPVETVEQLEQLERLVRTDASARERYITVLRQLKTHDTSLSETYQQLFADKLLIHYNYEGISPKYNKRPLKSLILFTDCMIAAWEDHMDVARVKEAVIEAVKISHNRYNQYNHRKRASYEWL